MNQSANICRQSERKAEDRKARRRLLRLARTPEDREEDNRKVREYRKKNKDKLASQLKRYFIKHKARLLEYFKTRSKNPITVERNKANAAAYLVKNRATIRTNIKIWKQRNKERLNSRSRQRYRDDVNYRILVTLRNRIYGRVKSKAESGRAGCLFYLGCTISFFKDYISTKFRHGMAWDNHGIWHLDHIIPCAHFDLSSENGLKKCFHYSNYQPLWCAENLSKSDTMPDSHQAQLL